MKAMLFSVLTIMQIYSVLCLHSWRDLMWSCYDKNSEFEYFKKQCLLTINNHIVFSLVLIVVEPPSVWGYERERGVPGRTIMLLLRHWDETLAGKTQGKTTLMHGASLQLELFLVFSCCPCREPLKQPVLSHLCVFVRLQLPYVCAFS